MSRLEEEVARQIKAEEIVATWQKCWNEMAKRCSSLGLSIASQSGEVLQNTSDSSEVLTQELVVARFVGGVLRCHPESKVCVCMCVEGCTIGREEQE